MNQTGPGLINTIGMMAIRKRLRSILTDTDASSAVTISTPTGIAPNYASGVITPTTTDNSVRGLLLELTNREIDTSAGKYQTGDLLLRIMVDDVSTKPTVDTSVVEGSNRYSVITVKTSVLGSMHYHLILRRSV